MKCKVISALPLRIRLRAGYGKVVFAPGSTANIPDEVALQYARLGLVAMENGTVPSSRKSKGASKSRTVKTQIKAVPLTERLDKGIGVGNTPQS